HNGGGVFVSGGAEENGSLVIDFINIVSNNAALNEGGGIYVENIESATIQGTIIGNTAGMNGGGLSSHNAPTCRSSASSLPATALWRGRGAACMPSAPAPTCSSTATLSWGTRPGRPAGASTSSACPGRLTSSSSTTTSPSAAPRPAAPFSPTPAPR